MTDEPLNADNIAPVPAGGLVPLYVDGEGEMWWSASLSGATVPDHKHDETAGAGGPAFVDFLARNTSGSSIPAFSAVRLDGASSTQPLIGLAKANLADDMPAVGITVAAIANGATGTVRQWGKISNIDTSAFAANDSLYVSGAAAGAVVNSPSPPTYITQRIGIVLVSDATVGSVFVYLDPQMDGHVSYTNRGTFEVNATVAPAALTLSTPAGGTSLLATPTGLRALTLPDTTDTLVGKATTDVLTNKTFDTAGAGNSLSINGLAATANTGTGAVVRADSPVFTTEAKTPQLAIDSSGSAFDLNITSTEALTADRGLRFNVADGDRTLTISGTTITSGTASVSGTNTGDQTITLTSDVTGTGTGSFATTIANNAVTDAKLRDSAALTVIGRSANSSGDPADIAATAAAGTVLRESGSTIGFGAIAVATGITAGTAGYSLKSSSAATPAAAWQASGIMFRREWQYLADPGAATGTRIGLLTAPTLSGTVSNQDSNVRPLIRHVTGAVSGNSAGVLSGFDVMRSGWLPKIAFVFQSGAAATAVRWWNGVTSADLNAVATPTTQHVAAFSYDTGRDGTAFWRTVTCDGAAATVTATTVAVATATTQNLRIELNGATNILFWIDDVLVNTHTTNLPSIATNLGFTSMTTTLGAATRRHEWSRIAGEGI